MQISPVFPTPLKLILILGVGCVFAGLELSQSDVKREARAARAEALRVQAAALEAEVMKERSLVSRQSRVDVLAADSTRDF